MVESGICETEQHEILATRGKMMDGDEQGLDRQRVEMGQEIPKTGSGGF